MAKKFTLFFLLAASFFCAYSYSVVFNYQVKNRDDQSFVLIQHGPEHGPKYWLIYNPDGGYYRTVYGMPVPYTISATVFVNLYLNGPDEPPDRYRIDSSSTFDFISNRQLHHFFSHPTILALYKTSGFR